MDAKNFACWVGVKNFGNVLYFYRNISIIIDFFRKGGGLVQVSGQGTV